MSLVLPVGLLPRGRQRDSLTALIPASCALGALVFVALAAGGRSLALAALGGLGVCFVPLAVVEPVVFTSGYVAIVATHIDDPMARLGFPSPWYGLNLIAGFHLYRLWSTGRLRLNWSVIHLFVLGFLATRLVGVLVAANGTAAVTQTTQIAKDTVALMVVTALLASVGGARWAILGAVVGFALLGWLAFGQEYVMSGLGDVRGFNHVSAGVDVGSTTVRHSGPLVDPNFWGRLLVTFFPLAVAAVLVARARWTRLAASFCVVGFLLAVYLTQSRGAFLSAFAGLGVFLVLAGWRYARWTLLAPVVVIVLLANPFTGPRMETLFQLNQQTTSKTDLSLVARKTALKSGVAMFADHPLFGIGTGNFVHEVVNYQRELGAETDGDASAVGTAAHNTYIETAAETGIVGLISLILLFGSSIVIGIRSLQRVNRLRPILDCSTDALWGAALIAGVVAYATASMFLHLVLFGPFLVLLALVADFDRSYRDIVQLQLTDRTEPRAAMNWRRFSRIGAALAGVTAILFVLVPLSRDSWTADASFTMAVRPRSERWIESYEFDMATRRSIIPAYIGAFMLSRDVTNAAFQAAGVPKSDRDRYTVAMSPTPNSAVLRVSVQGPDRGVARDVVSRFASIGVDRIESIDMPFVLRPIVDQSPSVQRTSDLRSGRLALVFGPIIVAMIGWVYVSKERSYRRSRSRAAPLGELWCT